nr:helix-turn-helix domain-containing protein [uncultured Gellertiella sp.]
MAPRNDIPSFFVYGEPNRALDVGFLHVETVNERNNLHFGNVSPHKHSQMGQITFWYRGAGEYRIEDQSFHFSAPSASFVPSNVVHGFAIGPDTDAIVVSVADDTLRALDGATPLRLAEPVFLQGRPGDAGWLRLSAMLELIAAEYREGEPATGKVLPGLLAVALSYIARLGEGAQAPSVPPGVALALALRKAVDRHYRSDHPVGFYVDLLHSTPHLLDKAARGVLGMPVKHVILERRLLEAKRLLMFTIRPVEDIAAETGFRDPAYFSRFFRKRVGQAPAAWRKAHLGN